MTNIVGAVKPPPPPRHGPSLCQGPPLQPHQGTAPLFRQRPSPARSAPVGRAYVTNKKEAATSGTIVTSTLFF